MCLLAGQFQTAEIAKGLNISPFSDDVYVDMKEIGQYAPDSLFISLQGATDRKFRII